MRVQPILAGVATMALIMSGTGAFGQAATGSLDNFDCVNDTGETAEGFEIDIEDIHAVDLVREFPSNFAGQEYVNRFGIPTVSEYDNTATGGHIGVKVTWAAAWDGTAWRAKFGSYVYGGVAERDGVAYVLKPAATQGDSCWLLGQGAGYASSGCDHFGLSFAYGVTLGVQRYHWLVPDPANPGHLKQALWTSKSGPIPPAPAMAYVPPAPNVPAMIRAVAEAAPPPEPAEPQWGDARWAKITTAWTKSAALLDQLQKNLVPLKSTKDIKVTTKWAMLQQPPAGAAGEKEDVENDPVQAGKVSLIRRYEYYAFTGAIDSETHEAFCAPIDNDGSNDCGKGPHTYSGPDPVTGVIKKYVEKGKFLGAHMEAVNLQ